MSYIVMGGIKLDYDENYKLVELHGFEPVREGQPKHMRLYQALITLLLMKLGAV